MVIHDDCLSVLKTVNDESVDMIYLDPPFYSQSRHRLTDSQGKEYFFADIWKSREEYLAFMKLRIVEMWRTLKHTGSIFLHCDDVAAHYLRMILDEVFGEDNFRSEIIWSYKRWSNSQKGLIPGHQTIFFYSKAGNYKFNKVYRDYSPTTNIDQILQERMRNSGGKVCYKYDGSGNSVLAKEKKGVPLSDVWEIPFLNPKAKERTGYPTQKPIELLTQILQLSTDKGDVILDPFCGSGTTLVAAKLMERNYLGIDINENAVELSRKRLESPVKTESRLLRVGMDAYKTKTEEELAVLKLLECEVVQRNKGIDGFLKKYYLNAPVAVKIQKRCESFQEAVSLLYHAGKKKNCSFMVLIRTTETEDDRKITVPPNLIIIDSYQMLLTKELQDRCSLTDVAMRG